MNWYMLTLVGEDRPGIVAGVTQALFEHGLTLGETSMMRLGGNFCIMMMVSGAADEAALQAAISDECQRLGLCLHTDVIQGGLHRHLVPNLRVSVSGADRAGIVAQVTAALLTGGFNILDLTSDVVGHADRPVYLMQIEGLCEAPVEQVETALAALRAEGVDVNVQPIETLVG